MVKVTFQELRQQVALYAAAMRKMGVRKGDRVVGEYSCSRFGEGAWKVG